MILGKLHCVKSVQIRCFSGPYFPVFGLNTEIYLFSVQMWENTDQKNSVFGQFLHNVSCFNAILNSPEKCQ